MARPMTPEQRDLCRRREARVWELRLEGNRPGAIVDLLDAEGLGRVDPGTVRRIVRRVERRVAARMDEQAATLAARHLSRLELIVEKAMAEWERSRQDAKRVAEKTVEEPVPAAKGKAKGAVVGRTERNREVRGRLGDPEFLRTAMAAMADQRKILGMDSPTRVRVDGRIESVAAPSEAEAALAERLGSMSDEEVRRLAELAEKAAGPDYLGLAGRLHDGDGNRN